MKTKIILTLSLIFSVGPVFAGSLVCSSSSLYSSSVQRDFGTAPPAGMVTGSYTLVYNQKVLLSYQTVQGLHVEGVPPYRVQLIGESKTLETTGGQISGSTIFTQTAVVNKVNPLNPSEKEEIATVPVVCKKTWAMVP